MQTKSDFTGGYPVLGPTFAALAGFVNEATVAPTKHAVPHAAPAKKPAGKAWSFVKLFRLRRERTADTTPPLSPTLAAMAGFVNTATGTPSSK